MSLDLVCLGNLIVDDVVLPDGRTRFGEPGGALLYTSLAAALWGTRVGIVAPVGDDYPKTALDALAARGVDTSGLRPLNGPGIRTWLLYERSARRVVHHLGAATHEAATPRPDDLGAEHLAARAHHLTPAPRASQARLVERLAGAGSPLSLDPHDPIDGPSLEAWRPVLASVDLLFANGEELPVAPGWTIPQTVESIRVGRLRRLAFKQGEAGGTFFDWTVPAGEPPVTRWAPRTYRVIDPTGAGDAFAGGVLSGLLAGETTAVATERGVVAASFALEDWGAAGLLTATRAAAERRRAEWFPAAATVREPRA